jgi:hypothetical protein
MLCIGLTTAERVGSVYVGTAYILLKALGNGGHVYGHLTKTVKLVPGEEQTGFFAHFAKSLN